MLNQLGDFTFVSFHRPEDRGAPPEIITQTCETIQRPGCDGTGVIRLGQKATAFQMRSLATCVSMAAAVHLASLYKEYVGDGPYGIIWGGANYTSLYDVVYVPLDVQITKLRRLSASTDGSQACVEALWTLQPIVTPET